MPDLNQTRDLVQGNGPAAAAEAGVLGGSLDALAEGFGQRSREQFSDAWLAECPLIRLRLAPGDPFERLLRSGRIGEPSMRDEEQQPRHPGRQHPDQRAYLAGAGDDGTGCDSSRQAVGTVQGIRRAGGVADDRHALPPEAIDSGPRPK
jgi:hypothetical protein